MKSILLLISFGYFFLFLVGMNKIFKEEDYCTNQNNEDLVQLESALERSASYDYSCTFTRGKVIQSGCFFWDLFFVKSYLIENTDGYKIRVFTREAIPNEGETLEIKGVFRQFHRGAYFEWFGLVEFDRGYLNRS